MNIFNSQWEFLKQVKQDDKSIVHLKKIFVRSSRKRSRIFVLISNTDQMGLCKEVWEGIAQRHDVTLQSDESHTRGFVLFNYTA